MRDLDPLSDIRVTRRIQIQIIDLLRQLRRRRKIIEIPLDAGGVRERDQSDPSNVRSNGEGIDDVLNELLERVEVGFGAHLETGVEDDGEIDGVRAFCAGKSKWG